MNLTCNYNYYSIRIMLSIWISKGLTINAQWRKITRLIRYCVVPTNPCENWTNRKTLVLQLHTRRLWIVSKVSSGRLTIFWTMFSIPIWGMVLFITVCGNSRLWFSNTCCTQNSFRWLEDWGVDCNIQKKNGSSILLRNNELKLLLWNHPPVHRRANRGRN